MSAGRLSREELRRMQGNCVAMLRDLAHPPAKLRAKRAIKAALGRASAMERDMLFWPAGFLLLGLAESAKALPDPEEALGAAERYYGTWLARGGAVRYADDALAGAAAATLGGSGGGAAGEALARVLAFLREAPRDPEGSLIYHPSAQNRCVYADGAGMAAVLLAEADPAAARRQLLNFWRRGMDPHTGLPYHGYLLAEGGRCEKRGLVGWGRAVGFLALGMAAYVRRHPEDGALGECFDRLMASALSWQREDGSFSWLLPAEEGHIDTSVTAMIGAALLLAKPRDGRSGRAAEALEGIERAVCSHLSQGWLTDALGECVDFAQHPQSYGIYPWGMGAGLFFLSLRAMETDFVAKEEKI